jgi:hypothetical protein
MLVERLELTRLEDHLQLGTPCRLLDGHDLLEHRRVVTLEERAAVDDHVDLVGTRLDRHARLGELQLGERVARREARRDAGDLHAAPAQRLLGGADERRVDADRGHARDRRVSRIGLPALHAQRADLALGVLPLECREIHHSDRQVERPELRFLLDRALLEAVDPLVHAHRVHAADPVEHRTDGARLADPRADERCGLGPCARLGVA